MDGIDILEEKKEFDKDIYKWLCIFMFIKTGLLSKTVFKKENLMYSIDAIEKLKFWCFKFY